MLLFTCLFVIIIQESCCFSNYGSQLCVCCRSHVLLLTSGVDDDEGEIGPCCYNIGFLALFGTVWLSRYDSFLYDSFLIWKSWIPTAYRYIKCGYCCLVCLLTVILTFSRWGFFVWFWKWCDVSYSNIVVKRVIEGQEVLNSAV